MQLDLGAVGAVLHREHQEGGGDALQLGHRPTGAQIERDRAHLDTGLGAQSQREFFERTGPSCDDQQIEPASGERRRVRRTEPLRRPRDDGPAAVTLAQLGHVAAVAIWLVPEIDRLTGVRNEARAIVRPWLELTRTTQGWGMFAPNPPRHNVFMKVLVTDADGEVWDMRTDVYADERRPLPFVWNDRMRKMSRRIIGGESGGGDWYRKWYARWHCRQWALEHGGAVPRSVELVKLSYSIPTPEAVRALGWYRPMDRLRDHGTQTSVHTEHCATAVLGQPIAEVAARHGIAVEKPRPWIKRRRAAWDERRTDVASRD
jgi:hypothetical protein